MTLFAPQPDWLYKMVYGLAECQKIRVLIDGTRFAVAQCPGGYWSDNSGSHYGCTTYHLVDKEQDVRRGVGLLDTPVLQNGGRAKLAQWKKLVEASDKAGKYVMEIKDERVAEGTQDDSLRTDHDADPQGA